MEGSMMDLLCGAIRPEKAKEERCPVCNSPLETKQYYDCCSAQCYKDKHV